MRLAGFPFSKSLSFAGSLLTALVIAFRGSARPATIALGGLVLGIAEAVLGLSGLLSVSLVAMAAVGVGTILMAATANTVIQLTVPDELRGRVMSVSTTVFAGSTPIGGLLMGWIAAQAGVGEAFAVGGLACIAIAGAAFLRLHQRPELAAVSGVRRPVPIATRPAPR